jgi:hypothetical protein
LLSEIIIFYLKELTSSNFKANQKNNEAYTSVIEIADSYFTWNGGSIAKTNSTKAISFTNTCSIDYYLLIWFIVYKLKKYTFKNCNDTFHCVITKIVTHIEKNQWSEARYQWSIFNKMKNSNNNDDSEIHYDYFSSEAESYIHAHNDYQTFRWSYICDNKCCDLGKDNITETSSGFIIE